MVSFTFRDRCLLLLLVLVPWSLDHVHGQDTTTITPTPARTPLVPSSLPHPTWACRPITSVPSPSGGYPITFAVGVYHCSGSSNSSSSSSPPLNMTRDSSRPMLSLIVLNDMPPGWRTTGYFGMARYTLEQYASQTINMLDSSDGQGGIILFHLNGNCTERAGLDVTYQALTVPGLIPIGIIGSVCSASTSAAALIAGNKRVPQISIAAASTSLSDKTRYPTLFRTCATTLDQARMFLSFCQYYGLAHIIMLYSDNPVGLTLIDNMNLLRGREMIYQYMMITYIPIPETSTKQNFTGILTRLRDLGHRVFLTNVILNPDIMLTVAGTLSMFQPGYVWLSPFSSIGAFLRTDSTTSASFIQNMIAASTYINTSHPLTQQVTHWAMMITQPVGESIGENHYNVHDATNVYLNAMSTVLQSHPTCTNYSCAISYLTGNNHMELLHAMSQTQIMSSAGYPLTFTTQGDRQDFTYMINNLRGSQPAQLVPVGLVIGPKYQELNQTMFPGQMIDPPTTQYTRYTYPTSLTTGIWVVAWLTVGICMIMMIMVTIYHNIPIIKASTVPFNYIILLGIALLAGHALLYVTEVGNGQVSVVSERERQHSVVITQGSISVALLNGGPRDWICHLRVWLTPLSVLLILLPVLFKTIRIAYIVMSKGFQVSLISNTLMLFIGVLCMLILQIIFTVILEMIDTPTASLIINSYDTTTPANFNEYENPNAGFTYWQCNTTNWFFAITCTYIGLLTIATTCVALRVRYAPQRFNESHQLVSIALFIAIYSILVLPIQFSLSSNDSTTLTDDRLTQVATFRAVGLLLGAWLILGGLYIPKAIILIKVGTCYGKDNNTTIPDQVASPRRDTSTPPAVDQKQTTQSKARVTSSHKSDTLQPGSGYEQGSLSMYQDGLNCTHLTTTTGMDPCEGLTIHAHEHEGVDPSVHLQQSQATQHEHHSQPQPKSLSQPQPQSQTQSQSQPQSQPRTSRDALDSISVNINDDETCPSQLCDSGPVIHP